ncbi:CPBP family intramembrane glutamic endopeptidase [Clostridium sp. D53t1_180928_C8]|uniref:CPBP family intramembrane glutamic endopeptidase n=1 Tax=Clostridium sp. D53t1_180928_C8 TaxID=2787101 RepID=UPI0018A9A1C0|nr:CPBP family intramembrane glutamic endopeptidase [Clostridium sp. D53t1_180928_C8]
MIFKNKYNEVRSGWKILLVFILAYALTFGATMLFGVIIGIFLLSNGNTDYLMNFNVDSTTQYELIFQLTTSINNILFILSCIIIWKLFEKKKISKMGITSIKKGYKELIVGLALGAVAMSIVAIVIISIGDVSLINPIRKPQITISLLYGLIGFIFVGFGEEILSRGYIMSVLKQTRNKWIVLIGPALIFAALHLGNNGIDLLSFINLFLVGVLFAYMFMKSKSLWMPIGYHITWNYFQGYVWGFGVSGISVNGLYKVENISNNIINGGAFGPEGGIVVTIITCLTFYFVYRYYKNNDVDEFMKIKNKEELKLN